MFFFLFPSRSDLANGFTMTEGRDGRYSTMPVRPTETAANQTISLTHTETNATAGSIYSGDGGAWQATEQSQRMGAGANQANGLSVIVVVYTGEGAQQINGLPGNHEEEPLAEGANGLNIHRAENDRHASDRNYVDNTSGCSLSVQEQGDGYAAAQAPILLPDFQQGEANLISSMGNAKKPTEHCCSTEEIN